MLCANCQNRLDTGQITQFDIDFSKWLLNESEEDPSLEDLNLRRAIKAGDRVVLIVKRRKDKEILESAEGLLDQIANLHGEPMILKGPVRLRRLIRTLIDPVIEVGVNNLYLPEGTRESIVILRAEDKKRIDYTPKELRTIASAVMGEPVLFEFQDRGEDKGEEQEGAFDEKMREFASRRRNR
ncbi:hypothetical protein EU538_01310 [Candidatus Thorarchaeota archaeon]|nr:MAG: hypothetical protein EU538_01310 [Candidatus Thorarchaeota archaeon]